MASGLRLAAVIPAAGLSSRMGTFKPLMTVGSQTVIEASVGNAVSAADHTVIVLGKRAGEIKELLTARFGSKIRFAENPGYAATDMLTSVRIALKETADCDAFFITPADMPMIAPSVYRELARSFCPDDDILIPVTDGRRGHPPLISARLIPDIIAYDGTDGLRGFYRGHRIREIEVRDTGILKDLDTPEDYAALIKNISNQDSL